MPTNDERRSRAARRILDKHRIRAEFARLKGSLPEPAGFRRGHWYPITDFNLKTSMVTVEVDEHECEIHDSLVVWRKDPPEKATVFSPSTFGAAGSEMIYVAVCPKGHEMGKVQVGQGVELACADCHGREYDWKFEKAGSD